MERTSDEGAATAADARPGSGARTPRDKARAYLDLWERHVVQTALHGPIPTPTWPPASS